MSAVDSLREEWQALADADTLHMLPPEALIASIKELAEKLLYVTSPEVLRTKTGRIIFEEDIEEWANEAEAGYDPERLASIDVEGFRFLRGMELLAWVGPDEFDGSRGIKSGLTPAGLIPMVAKGEHSEKIARTEIVTQMQRQANQFGSPRWLARFRYDGIVLSVHAE